MKVAASKKNINIDQLLSKQMILLSKQMILGVCIRPLYNGKCQLTWHKLVLNNV